MSGYAGEGPEVGWHAYTGPAVEWRWHVNAATPHVNPSTLATALRLVAQCRATAPIPCAAEDEAFAVMKDCANSLYLTQDNMPRRRHANLIVTKQARLYVLMSLFRLRFASAWEASAAQRAEAAEKQDWDRLEETDLYAWDAYRKGRPS